MKAGWEEKQIGDICKTGAGGTPLKSKNEYYDGGSVPWLQSGEVAQGEITAAKKFITEEGLQNSSAKVFPTNSILVAMYGATAGAVGKLRFPASTNQAVCGIYPNEKIIPEYLFYALLEKQAELIATASGNAQPNISQIKVKKTKIPLPPLAEQKQIVSVLDQAFAGIERATQAARKNRDNARELFETTLNATFTQKGEGWVEKTIAQLVDQKILDKPLDGNHGEIHPKKSEFVVSGIPFVMASDLSGGHVNQETCNFISREQAQSLRKGFAKTGDVLLSHKGTIGRTAILETDHPYVVLTPQVTYYRIRDTESLNNKYLRIFFRSPNFLRPMKNLAGAGSTRAYIGITKQLELSVSFPPRDIQLEIVKRVERADLLTQRLEALYQQKLDVLDELKQSLLQKAFAGELTADFNAVEAEDALAN